MAKRAASNNRPWPQNIIYDFGLPMDTSDEAASAFIEGLPTTERNKAILRLRYINGKPYTEIAPIYGITPAGARFVARGLMEKYGGTTEPMADALPQSTADEPIETQSSPVRVVEAQIADTAKPPEDHQGSAGDAPEAAVEPEPAPQKPLTPDIVVRQELKPIITAIATTTRQKTYAYDLKTRVVVQTDSIPRGLRRESRYIALPDYYQIKEYDMMQAFAETLSSAENRNALQTALGGLGPFKAFRETLREKGLTQAWADFKYQRFIEMAAEWWDTSVAPRLLADDAQTSEQPAEDHQTKLIVDPATLNGIALIETIRVLYHRVSPENFEAALDELRDALCQGAVTNG